jgi:hypothetical protein
MDIPVCDWELEAGTINLNMFCFNEKGRAMFQSHKVYIKSVWSSPALVPYDSAVSKMISAASNAQRGLGWNQTPFHNARTGKVVPDYMT